MQNGCIFSVVALSLGLTQPIQAKASSNFYLVKNTTNSSPNTTESATLAVLKGQGVILDDDRPQDGALFLIDYTHSSNNGVPTSTIIRQSDKAGNLLVTEETVYDSRGQLLRYIMQQNQINAKGIVERVGQSFLLTWTENKGTILHKEHGSQNTVTSGSLLAYMNTYIEELKLGKTLDVKLAIPERGSSYSFDILPQNNTASATAADLGVIINLSNFILRKLISPIKMTFQNSPEGYRPLRIVAPAAVRKKVGNSLEKFTARIEYPRQ